MNYETIYQKLEKLLPELQEGKLKSRKLKAGGFMDLNVDVLFPEEDRVVIALSHYYRHDCGDMIADPDMEIAVMPKRKMAEALTYQDAFGYRRVYPEPGKVDIRAKKDLNEFLNTWLSNLLEQGHS